MFSLLVTDSLYKLKHYLEEENKCKRRILFKVYDVLINFLAKINSIYSIPFRSLESILKIFSGIMCLNALLYTFITLKINGKRYKKG